MVKIGANWLLLLLAWLVVKSSRFSNKPAKWGVPDDLPSEKSIGCRDFGDGVRSGEGLGTLRRLPKAPISLVGHFEGGSSGGKMAKNGQKDNF